MASTARALRSAKASSTIDEVKEQWGAHQRTIRSPVYSETDQTEDLKRINVPTLVMHADNDQVMPIANAAEKMMPHLPNGTLNVYGGLSHSFFSTHPDLANWDLLAFVQRSF